MEAATGFAMSEGEQTIPMQAAAYAVPTDMVRISAATTMIAAIRFTKTLQVRVLGGHGNKHHAMSCLARKPVIRQVNRTLGRRFPQVTVGI
jgi:hypothetical protein